MDFFNHPLFNLNILSTLHFQWPWVFSLLLLIPIYWQLYIRNKKRHWHNLARFSYVAFLEQVNHQPALWKRLLNPITTSIVLGCLILSMAKPVITARVSEHSINMMLVMDISLSMLAKDLKPNRLQSAKQAAIDFVDSLPDDVKIGLELFAGNNYVVEPPTKNHKAVTTYLNNLKEEHLQLRTEIGSALKTAIDTLTQTLLSEKSEQKPTQKEKAPPQQVIILLSDGDSQEGYPWHLASAKAKENNISIYTVGIGSEKSTSITYEGQELPVYFNENTLKQIARLSNGNYYRVFTENDFKEVYQTVREHTISTVEKELDIAYLFSGLALLTLILGYCVQSFRVEKL